MGQFPTVLKDLRKRYKILTIPPRKKSLLFISVIGSVERQVAKAKNLSRIAGDFKSTNEENVHEAIPCQKTVFAPRR